jgi:alpha-L-fucosidase 2
MLTRKSWLRFEPTDMRRFLLLGIIVPALLTAGLKENIEFARRGDQPLLMDAFIPEGKGPFPAIIWVHGGGFVAGDKKPAPKTVLAPLEQKGWAWFSVNYRLAPTHPFPAQTDDVEASIAYIKTHQSDFRIDPRRLVLMGASAGGHLVSFVGAHHKKSNQVAGVVSFFGEHDLVDRVHTKGSCMIDGKVVENPGPLCLSPGLAKFLGITATSPNAEEVVRKASPATYIRKQMPAYLLIHGTKDFSVPYDQSERMLAAMKAAGAKCELVRVEGGGHGFGEWDKHPSMSGYKQQMFDWLDREIR